MKYTASTFKISTGKFVCPAQPGILHVVNVGFRPKRVTFFVSKSPGAQSHFCCGQGSADDFGCQHSITWAGIAVNCFRGDSSDTHCINVTNVSQITVKAKLISMDNKGFTLEFDLCNELFTIRWEAVG